MWINCILKVLASESTRCHIIASYTLKTIFWKIICARAVLCRVCSLVNWTLLCSERAAGHIWVQIVELYSPLHWLPALGLGWFDANMFGCLCICSTFINLSFIKNYTGFFCRSKTTPLVTLQRPLMGLRTLIPRVHIFAPCASKGDRCLWSGQHQWSSSAQWIRGFTWQLIYIYNSVGVDSETW